MIGAQVGNYRIVSVLGEGGMGRVYLAEHPELGRRAAVKVLSQDLARSPEMIQRFFNEARAAHAVGHPGIVEIFDCGTLSSGEHYITMEYLGGESLAARLARAGRRAPEEAVIIASQTAAVLEAAHARGIVHRDLKPEHIFLVGDGVKILDFGIAKLLEAPPAGVAHTRTGTVMGTPRYMSPEQCRATKSVDQRADIYALGVILYEMLCGTTPFASDSWGELVHMHIGVAPSPLRARNPQVSEGLERTVLKALAKDPAERQQSMAQLRQELAAPGLGPTMVLIPDVAPAVTMRLPGSTTLGSAATEKPEARQRRARLLMSGLAAAAFALAMTATVLVGGRRSAPSLSPKPPRAAEPAPVAAPEPIPPPPTITVAVVTVPDGTRVVRERDGATLGVTPWKTIWPRGAGGEELRLEREGYRSERVFVTLDRDQNVRMELQALPARPAAAPRAAPVKSAPLKKKREPLKI